MLENKDLEIIKKEVEKLVQQERVVVDKNLKGKLLMIHGAQDNVVVWQHSILYQKKAVDKGVQLDYYVYPGHEHNVLGKDRAHLMEKICNYFIDNL